MRAAVFKGGGRRRARGGPGADVEADDDVIIDVEACGICGTRPPDPQRPAGPSGGRRASSWATSSSAGSARSARSADGLAVGQRVTVDPDPKCGVCGPCRAGRPASCENVRALGIFRDGALAPSVKAPADAVFPPVRRAAGADRRADRAAGLRRQRRQQGQPHGPASRRSSSAPARSAACSSRCSRRPGRRRCIVVEPQEARAADRHGRRGRRGRPSGRAGRATRQALAAVRRRHRGRRGRDAVRDGRGTCRARRSDRAVRPEPDGPAADPPVHDHGAVTDGASGRTSPRSRSRPPSGWSRAGALRLEPIVTHVLPLDRVAEGLDLLRSGDGDEGRHHPIAAGADRPAAGARSLHRLAARPHASRRRSTSPPGSARPASRSRPAASRQRRTCRWTSCSATPGGALGLRSTRSTSRGLRIAALNCSAWPLHPAVRRPARGAHPRRPSGSPPSSASASS